MAGSSERMRVWKTGPVPDLRKKTNVRSVHFRYQDTRITFSEAYQRPATGVN